MSDIQQTRFSAESLELVEKIKKRYPEGKQRSALLPVLHIAQAEFGGWLSAEVMDYVASLLDLKPIEVYEVATFYTMYNLEPVGNYAIKPFFSDGHESGLYTWEYLYQLGSQQDELWKQYLQRLEDAGLNRDTLMPEKGAGGHGCSVH